jgi:hypothetical protein
VTYNSLFFTLDYYIVYGTRYLYQSGYYVVLNGKEYQVLGYESNAGYPSLPSPAASYTFASLTLMPSGLIPYLNNPSYTQIAFFEDAAGLTDITGVSTTSAIGQGKYYYDETTQTLTFAEALQPGEYIKMLYK